MMRSLFAGPRPRVFGHRGAGGEAPENTLPSFERARACGVDVFELDVHATRDGTIVVLHDPTLERTTDGSGALREQTWEAVQRLDAGYHFTTDGAHFPFRARGVRVPSLDELFRRFPDLCFNIEVKQETPPIAAAVVQLVLDRGLADRVVLAAEHDGIMEAIRAAAADRISTSFATGEVVDFMSRLQGAGFADYRPAGRALQIPVSFGGIDLVTADSVRAAHDHDLEMHVWTINDRVEMDALLRLGVDGIISDLPAIARAAVDEYRHTAR